jgi:hypothetical protein
MWMRLVRERRRLLLSEAWMSKATGEAHAATPRTSLVHPRKFDRSSVQALLGAVWMADALNSWRVYFAVADQSCACALQCFL